MIAPEAAVPIPDLLAIPGSRLTQRRRYQAMVVAFVTVSSGVRSPEPLSAPTRRKVDNWNSKEKTHMPHSRTALNMIAAAAIAAAFLTVLAGDAQAYVCKSTPTQAHGTSYVKAAATNKAVQNWSASAKAQFGLPWSVWSIALGHKVKCTRTAGKHTCLASAKPCQYVVQ
jgi:hypothetical protein